jgi:histidinol-phosphate aminotransferase
MTELKYRKSLESIATFIPGKPIEEVKREYGIGRVIKLASNENSLGCSPDVRPAVLQALEKAAVYPESSALELRKELAFNMGLRPEQFIIGAGSFELLSFIAHTFMNPGEESIAAMPSFGWYATVTKHMDGFIVNVPLKEHHVDLNEIKARVTGKTRVIWLCNPNNPTGTIFTEAEQNAFLKDIPGHIVVVLDEAYFDYVTAKDYPVSQNLINRYPNVIILRTFSKIYGLASLRVAYAIADANTISYLNKVRQVFNVNAVAQAAAIASLRDKKFREAGRKNNFQGREYLYKSFKEAGLEFIPTEGNFMMVNVSRDGNEVFEALLKKGVIIRPGNGFNMPTWLRVTIGTPEENQIFIHALKEVLD